MSLAFTASDTAGCKSGRIFGHSKGPPKAGDANPLVAEPETDLTQNGHSRSSISVSLKSH